jgi:hypothetical protein
MFFGLQYSMPKQPSNEDLLGAIAGGSSLSGYGGASAQPSVDMNAAAASTPVKLMQKFVNNRGWGDVDVTGMRDWRGNVLSNPSMSTANANVNADADKWAALSILLNRMNGRNRLIYDRQNGGGVGGNNSAASSYGGGGGKF